MKGTKLIKLKAEVDNVRVPEKHHTKQIHLSPHRRAGFIGKILVPIDFSLPSKRALEYAAMFVRKFGSSITLLHVLKPTVSYADYGYGLVLRQFVSDTQVKRAQARLNALSKQWLAVKVPSGSLIRTGTPESEIIRAAKELGIGLIVMASHGCGTSKGAAPAGIAQTVVGLAGCPVLVVRNKKNRGKKVSTNHERKDSITLN